MTDFSDQVAALVKAKAQQRHASGQYAIAGHPAETRLLTSGKRAKPLQRAIEDQAPQDDTDADD